MSKYKVSHINAFIRAVMIMAIAAFITVALGLILRELLDYVYQSTGNYLYQSIFIFLSTWRYLLGGLICVAALIIFSGWIFAPVFNSFADFMSENIHVSKEDALTAPPLPKSLRKINSALADINKEIWLWKYSVKEAEQRKDDLVVYLAHDIRTPLTSVLGYLELIRDNPELPLATREKYLGIAYRKATRMQNLVEELFEVTKFNVGRIELERAQVKAETLFYQLIEELMPLVKSKNIEVLFTNYGIDTLFVDADKFARVIDNVLHNAAYYTPKDGEIRIVLDQTEEGRARISISNSGASISQEKLDRFFEKFYRGDEARSSESGGSGLGLAIAKNIIEAHNGTITAANINDATTFTIII